MENRNNRYKICNLGEDVMSEREEIQNRFVEWFVDNELAEVYGALTGQQKQYRSVTFCKSAILNGEVRIYSPKWILVTWDTTIKSLSENGKKKFNNEEDAKEFIKHHFVFDK